jgi:integrase
MPRQATGQVVVRERKAGRVYALRFRAYGGRQYVTLGTDAEGWSEPRAEVELGNVLADVRRGIWKPPNPEPAPRPPADPTFHEFASEWWAAKRGEMRPNTRADYEWQLSGHLLPYFARLHLSEITVADVDKYRRTKVEESERRARALAAWQARLTAETDRAKRRELARQRPPKPLSAASINKTLTRLGQILDVADEYGMIPRNPLRVNPRNRKLKVIKPPAVWLDRADQIEALLEAAGELDRRARPDRRHVRRRTMLAVLVFGGLRLGELLSLRWRDVDLEAGRLRVAGQVDDQGKRRAKTEAGIRYVEILPMLHALLADCRRRGADDLVFPTTEGTAFLPENFRERVFETAVALANERRAAADLAPLPEGLTPHKLRHTCCSLLFVCGYELPRVMAMLGHADSAVTLRIYAHVMSTDEGERERLRALIGHQWAPRLVSPSPAGIVETSTATKKPRDSGAF